MRSINHASEANKLESNKISVKLPVRVGSPLFWTKKKPFM